MRGTLLIAVLSVRSSYIRNIEELTASADASDTVQWWLGSAGVWRIKTFALDHDIHTHSVGQALTLEQARDNTQRHYGDVIQKLAQITVLNANDDGAVRDALKTAGLAPIFEVASDRFIFWKPEQERYFSQSTPS